MSITDVLDSHDKSIIRHARTTIVQLRKVLDGVEGCLIKHRTFPVYNADLKLLADTLDNLQAQHVTVANIKNETKRRRGKRGS